MASFDRRTLIRAGAGIVAGTALGAPRAVRASGSAPAAGAHDAPLFHRLRFEGTKAIDGAAVRLNQAGVRMVPVVGGKYRVWTKRLGSGRTKVLALHGGPGATHEYIESLEDFLPGAGYELYYYDQLGCGNSDHPDDDALWTVERYRQEVEEVRAGLGLENFVIYGHSWGGMLAQEYAITYPQHLKAVVISDMTAGIPSYVAHVNALRKELPAEVIAELDAYEAKGQYDAPAYQELLISQVYRRHLCRLDPWPEPLERGFAHINEKIYNLMQGPSEFTVTGNFKDWDRWADLHKIKAPTLLIVGRYDTMSADDIARMGKLIPNSRVAVCENGSHCCHWDDQEAYFRHLLGFLRDVDAGKFPKAKKA
jgi:proline iminopeptidase